jgi:uncharacterized membrane protein
MSESTAPKAAAQRVDRLLMWCLVMFTVAVRLATLPMVETGGDAIGYWLFIRQALLGHMPPIATWDHRTVRWGVTGVGWLLARVFGTHPFCYYLAPLCIAATGSACLFALARRLSTRNVAFWCVVTAVVFPPFVQSGGQLMPGVFSAAYVLGSVLCLMVSVQAQHRRILWAAASGGCLFLAYLTKLPNVLFIPGLVGASLLLRAGWSRIAAAGTAFLIPCLIENAIYRVAFGRPLGRLSFIIENHLKVDTKPLASWWELLERYTGLDGAWELLFYAFSTALVISGVRHRKVGRQQLALLLIPSSFLLLTGLGVKSWDPLMPVQPFRDRYLIVAAPLMILSVFLCAESTTSVPCLALPSGNELSGAVRRLTLVWAFAGVMLPEVGWSEHPLRLLPKYRAMTLEAFEKGIPIISRSYRGKPLWVVQSLFWNPVDFPAYPLTPPPVHRVGRTYYLIDKNKGGDPRGNSQELALLKSWKGTRVVNAYAIQNVLFDKFKLDLFRMRQEAL